MSLKKRRKLIFDRIVGRWNWQTARRRALARVLFAATIAAAAAPTWAEQDPTLMPVATSTAPAAGEAAPSQADSPVLMDEVVVTGEGLSSPKHTEPLRNIPQTISVVPLEIIEDQGATTLRDVLRNVPGISMQAGEGGTPAGDQMTIRGFSARTDIFIDGLRDFGGYSRDSFNLEQVEVSKGPSSSYAGRGSTGGSINLASKAPKLEAAHAASFRVGNERHKRGTLDINRPLPFLSSALRVNALSHSAFVPGRNTVEEKRWGVAPSLALGLGKPTRLTASYFRMVQDNVPDYGLPWVPVTQKVLNHFRNEPAPVDWTNYYGVAARDFEKVKTDVATLKLERDFGSAVILTNQTRVGRTVRDSIITSPRFISDDSTDIRRTDWKTRDQVDEIKANQTDVTARFETGPLSHAFVVGVETAREESVNHNRIEFGTQAGVTDLFHPNPDTPYTGSIRRDGAKTEATAKSLSYYAFETLKIGEKLEIPMGIRNESFDAESVAVSSTGVSIPASRKDRMTSWRMGLVYKPEPTVTIYFGYGTSFNPSAEGLALSTTTALVAPEQSASWEFGTKREYLGGRLLAGAAVFRTLKTNARTPSLIPGDPQVLKGRQRVDGLELSASGKLLPIWDVLAAATFLESEVVQSNTPLEVGLELTNTPRQSYSVWNTVQLPARFQVGAGAQFTGRRFNSLTLASRRQAGPYWTYDAMAGWDSTFGLGVRLNVANLTDTAYVDRLGGGHFIPGPGRLVTVTTELKF